MGKGQRAREMRAQNTVETPKKVTKKTQKKNKAWLTPVILVVVVVILAGVLVLNYLSENGVLDRRKIVMKSENYEVTGTMLKYGAAMAYQNFTSNYSDYLSYFGLDTSKKLSSQKYGDGTWYDYFKEGASEVFTESLVYAEGAKEAGIELEQSDLDAIEASIKNIASYAAAYGYTEKAYIATMFGKGVNKSDIRDYFKLITLANKYQTKLTDEKTAEMTADDVESYYKANLNTYSTVDVLYYSDKIAIPGEMSDAEKEEMKQNFLSSFSALSGATSAEEFRNGVPADEVTEYGEVISKTGEVTEGTFSYSEISITEAADWLFETENDEYVRLADEVKTFEDFTEGNVDEEGVAADSLYSIAVYYVVNAPHPDNSVTKNVGHILLRFDDFESDEAAKAKADEVLAEYLAGEHTKERFEEIGKKYTADSNVFYENVAEGKMVEEFNNWIFDPARTPGETAVVRTADYGYHVMYFEGDGEEAWYADCLNGAVSETIANLYSEMTEKYTVTKNESAIKSIRE